MKNSIKINVLYSNMNICCFYYLIFLLKWIIIKFKQLFFDVYRYLFIFKLIGIEDLGLTQSPKNFQKYLIKKNIGYNNYYFSICLKK